mmetsp:Transcript_18047/g.34471  ORF Transcript_18047/g.34471 Transcript_18047/m.34471 type:complete len:123 (-) Transcript_18047:15-383(-)
MTVTTETEMTILPGASTGEETSFPVLNTEVERAEGVDLQGAVGENNDNDDDDDDDGDGGGDGDDERMMVMIIECIAIVPTETNMHSTARMGCVFVLLGALYYYEKRIFDRHHIIHSSCFVVV